MSQKSQNNKGLSFRRGVAAATLSFLVAGTLPATAHAVAGDSDGGLDDGDLASTTEVSSFLTIESDENDNPVVFYNGQFTELRALAPSGTVIEYQGSWMSEPNTYSVSDKFDADAGEFFRIVLDDIPQWSSGLTVTISATTPTGEVASSITVPVVEGTSNVEPPRPDTSSIPENAILLTGTALAGSEVHVLINGEENELGVGYTDTKGFFTISLPELGLEEGDELTLVAVDSSDGLKSPPSSVIAVGPDSGIDYNGGWDVPPPEALYAVANGVVIKYDATALTYILRDESGNLLGMAHARDAFNGGVFIEAPVYSGQRVIINTRNVEGYESMVGEYDVEIQGPPEVTLDTLSIDPENPVVSGSTEPDASVILSIGSGSEFRAITSVKADEDGNFSVTLPLDDEVVTELKPFDVRVTGAFGTSSPVRVHFAGTDMDYAAPDVPESFENGILEGSTRANFAVRVIDAQGNEVGNTTADENGDFSVLLDGFPEATVFNVYGIDRSGNETPHAQTMTADLTAPTGSVGFVAEGQEHIDVEVSDDPSGVNVTVVAEDGTTVLDSVEGLRAPRLNWTAEIPGYENGTILYVQFSDGSGNLGERVQVQVGQQVSRLSVIAPSVTAGDTTVSGTVRGADSEEDGIVTVYVTVNGAEYETEVNPDNNTFAFQLDDEIRQNDTIIVWAVAEDGLATESVTVEVLVDQIDAPRLDNVSEGSTSISGVARNAEKVRLYAGNSSEALDEATVDSDTFQFTFDVDPLISGDVYYVAGVDRFGVEGLRAQLTVGQSTTIDLAVDRVVAGQTSITGVTSAGAEVVISVNNGEPVYATAGEDGRFSANLDEALVDGDTVRVIASVERNSRIVNLEVGDSTAPDAPEVFRLNNTSEEVAGQTEPGAVVNLFVDGNSLGEIEADEDGMFSYDLESPLEAGSVLRATATDEAGNTSESTERTVEDVIPPALEVNPVEYGDSVISGTTDAGARVTVLNLNREEIASVVANSNGGFSLQVPNLDLDATYLVQSSKTGGPVSEQTVQVRDTTAPEAPHSIGYQNEGKLLTGSTEPGTTVLAYRPGETSHFASATVDDDGLFSMEIGDIPVGTNIELEAMDGSENRSARLRVTIPERGDDPTVEIIPGDDNDGESDDSSGDTDENGGGDDTSLPGDSDDDIVYEIDENGNLVPVTSAAEDLEQTGSDAARAAGVAVMMFAAGGVVFALRRRMNEGETA